jgi:alkylation response protein AidB-like acyl-CoA dehydrogenase
MQAAETEVTALIAAAEALAPLVAEHRAALARGPDLPAPVAAALHAAGLTRLWLPRALGGPELPPADYIQAIEAVARLDGAVGWCAAIASSGARLVGLLAPEVAATMAGPGRGSLSGSVNPAGAATEATGGWHVSGRWSWGSFIRYSEWTTAMCVVREPDGAPRRDASGAPALLLAMVPTAEVRILNTWDAGGLRATGSHDFEISSILVPVERVVTMDGFDARGKMPGALYDLPFATVFTLGIAPVSLGIARRAIDALVALAGQKTPTGTGALLREQASTQDAVARAEAELRAARAFLFEAVGAFWEAAQRGEARNIHTRALVRLACWQAAQAGKRVSALMYDAAGGTATDERHPFAACLRDANAAGQHIAFAQRNLETAGRVFLGMEAGTARF